MTTYVPPDKFEHGEFPTASTAGSSLDSIKNALAAIAELITDGSTPATGETLPKMNFAVYWNREKGEAWGSSAQTDSDYWIFHRDRYLHYTSSGTIEDPVGTGENVSLSNNDTFNVYDLDTVSWLVYGAMYKVTGVDFCCEDTTP